MRLPRVRFRLRALMGLVAAVAVAFPAGSWVAGMAEKSRNYRVQARYYRTVVTVPGSPEYLKRFTDWKQAMIRKYDRAAWFPWVDVPPDEYPPQP